MGYKHGGAITPDDNNDTGSYDAIFVGVGGDIEVITDSGKTILFKNCATGAILDVSHTRVLDTNTTATDLIGLE